LKKYLVFWRADDQSLHCAWLAPPEERNFDVYLEYFGNQPGKFSGDCEYYSQNNTGKNKFERFQRLFHEQKELFLQYEAIWFVDDDIVTDAKTVNQMFELFVQNQLWLAQPALTPDSYYSHWITLCNSKYYLRFTNFVEVMAPIFSRFALLKCIETFSENQSSWGLDFVWPKILGDPKDKIAILDATQIKHTRPVGAGALYKGMTVSPLAEMRAIMQKYGVELDYKFKVYGGKRRLRVASVSMVKNEADIIESFVRYHSLFFDHMFILDSGSTDGTYRILELLKAEGLALTVLKEDMTAFNQPQAMSRLLRHAAQTGNYDLIIPLDADEFLVKDDGGDLRDFLEQLPLDEVYYVLWRTFIPHPADNCAEKFIPARMRHARWDKYETFHKVLVPAKLVLSLNLELKLGSHDVNAGSKVKRRVIEGLRINHYPVRSCEQLKSKVIIGWLSHISRPDSKDYENWHWRRLYEAFLDGRINSQADLVTAALEYSSQYLKDSGYSEPVAVREVPFALPQGKVLRPIIYTDDLTLTAEGNILRFAEKLAGELAYLKKTAGQTTLAIRPDVAYKIVNRQTKLALQAAASGKVEVVTTVTQERDEGNTNQLWRFEPVGDGCYLITNCNSGQVLDINSLKPGSLLRQSPRTGGFNQQWYIVNIKPHCYRIVNRYSLQCLEVIDHGKQVIQNYATKYVDQQWYLVPAY